MGAVQLKGESGSIDQIYCFGGSYLTTRIPFFDEMLFITDEKYDPQGIQADIQDTYAVEFENKWIVSVYVNTDSIMI